jgi:hypothetical protein
MLHNGLAILLRGIQLKVEQATRTRQQKLLVRVNYVWFLGHPAQYLYNSPSDIGIE